MSKYIIKNPTLKHIASINKDLVEAGVVDEQGKVFEKVSMWKTDWPQDITEGLEVLGEVREVEKNGYKNFNLYPERTNPLRTARPGNPAIAKAMETKNENIKAAQERKDESMKLAGIQRDSVLIVTTFYKESFKLHSDEEMEITVKNKIAEWKKFLEQSYGDGQPFN